METPPRPPGLDPSITMDPGPRPLVVGVAGPARAGKDTLINAIEQAAGLRRFGGDRQTDTIAWADGVKRATADMFGLTMSEVCGHGTDREAPHPKLNGRTIREALQTVGTMGRTIDPDIWVRRTMDSIALMRARIVLVSGTRYQNEVDACDLVVWVERPDAPAVSGADHSSENSIDKSCALLVVVNDRDVEYLRNATAPGVLAYLRQIAAQRTAH